MNCLFAVVSTCVFTPDFTELRYCRISNEQQQFQSLLRSFHSTVRWAAEYTYWSCDENETYNHYCESRITSGQHWNVSDDLFDSKRKSIVDWCLAIWDSVGYDGRSRCTEHAQEHQFLMLVTFLSSTDWNYSMYFISFADESPHAGRQVGRAWHLGVLEHQSRQVHILLKSQLECVSHEWSVWLKIGAGRSGSNGSLIYLDQRTLGKLRCFYRIGARRRCSFQGVVAAVFQQNE